MRRAIRKLAPLSFAAAIALVLVAGLSGAAPASETQPYRATEFVVSGGQGFQGRPSIWGDTVVWRYMPTFYSSVAEIRARNLGSQAESVLGLTGDVGAGPDIYGDTVVWVDGASIMSYNLASQQRSVLYSAGEAKSQVRLSAQAVVWQEKQGLFAYDRSSGATSAIAAQQILGSPDIWDRTIVWAEMANQTGEIFLFDMATGSRTRLSTQADAVVTPPAISAGKVAWAAWRGDGWHGWHLLIRDLASGNTTDVPISGVDVGGVDIDGELVVWSQGGDVFGYDIVKKEQFVVSRSVGGQLWPRISGHRVVWTDTRNSGIGKYDRDESVYGALLEDGPAPPPPATGVPDAVDARIEIVWPEDKPVSEADRANIEAVLFRAGSLDLPACQWSPEVELWGALNNEPARPLAYGLRWADYMGGKAMPAWAFNQVDVSKAKDPANKIYFFAKPLEVPSRWNVWSHGADARTYYPEQDVPTGIGDVDAEMYAKIEIVWPHGDAPVSQARLVNIKAMVFLPGTLVSAPPGWNPTVRLLAGLNTDVLKPVAVGTKRLETTAGFTYPVWDFNNIDVSQATVSEMNKYFFSLEIDGVTVRPNVWAHGSSGLTYFPQKDTPTSDCDRLNP